MLRINYFSILLVTLSSNCCFASRLNKHLPAESQNINIVGLFGENEEEEIRAFDAAVYDINHDASILRKTSLVRDIEKVDLKNSPGKRAFVQCTYRGTNASFPDTPSIAHCLNLVCKAMSSEPGITAIFGANSFEGVSLVQSIAETFRIPYFFSVWDAPTYTNGTSFNLFPMMESVSEAIETIIHDMDWTSFTLLYEDEDDFVLFQELLIRHEVYESEENYSPIMLKQLPRNDDDLGPLLKELQNRSETRIVLNCSRDRVLQILRKAKSLRLMGDYFAYVIMSLDAHSIDFSEFIPTHTNITVITLIDQNLFYEDDSSFDPHRSTKFVIQNVNVFTSQAFLVYDSVYFFAKALDRFLEDRQVEEKVLDCESDNIFTEGDTLVDVIRGTESVGIVGQIRMNEKGDRNYHTMNIFQVSPKKRNKLGSWNPDTKLEYTRNKTQMMHDEEEFIANRTFVVSSILSDPYLMKCQNETSESTKEPCYEGFSKDLIEAIAEDLKFDYRIVLAPDGKRGSRDPATGKWNGIIKELQERRADLGICDLTITSERRQAVDFTKPFMSLGISILYRKGKEEETHLFSFLEPLEFQVWLFVATSLLGVSITLFFVSRLSPYDWESSHPCVTETEELENALSLVNCLWFSLGSVLQQGCDILPKAVSSRIVSAMWWFFTLIMVSTYTANLAAFLTSKQMESDIKDVEALASQSAVKYGCGKEGSTATFFQTSNDNLYQKIWATMESAKPSVFTKDNDEGKNRVLRDKQYAFFMESSTIEYLVERHCELTQVGGLLDNKGYGIGMPLNSPFRTQITTSLLKQQENGNIKKIKNKWWINNDESKKCQNTHKEEGENALDVSNVGGVFVVLIVGMGIAFTISILEFLWNIRKVAVVEKIPLSAAFWKELHFVINCHISTKPVRKPSEKLSFSNDPPDRYKVLMALGNIQKEPEV